MTSKFRPYDTNQRSKKLRTNSNSKNKFNKYNNENNVNENGSSLIVFSVRPTCPDCQSEYSLNKKKAHALRCRKNPNRNLPYTRGKLEVVFHNSGPSHFIQESIAHDSKDAPIKKPVKTQVAPKPNVP